MRYIFFTLSAAVTMNAMIAIGLGQEERPLIDLQSEAIESASEVAEDIPPPAPVPDNAVDEIQSSESATGAISTAKPIRVGTQPTGPEVRAYDFGISYQPTDGGMKVNGVIVGSRASIAGVKPGDVIASLNGGAASADTLQQNRLESLTVIRGDRQIELRPGTQAAHANSTRAPVGATRSGVATYTPQRRTVYSVPQTTYSVPRTYRYSPSYDYRYAPGVAYRTAAPYSARYYSYARRPSVSIGIGVGGRGSIGYGPGIGYIGPGYRYGGFGPYSYGRGIGYRRSGFGITIGF